MQYTFRCANYSERYVQIEFRIPNSGLNPIQVQLPAWRPGRYELQNFAKNIRNFSATRPDGSLLPSRKVTKDRWEIEPQAHETLIITYEYYANQLDAGGTFVDYNQWYINPCTCCVYVVGRENESIEAHFEVPHDYALAGGWQPTGPHSFSAPNFDTLADAPLILSNDLNHRSFKIDEHQFHIWFMGWPDAPWERILPAFEAFSKCQVEAFEEFTVPEYHFLYQILPTRKYHGVEHLNSTVICLGPHEDMTTPALWEQFLGVSSHELYHTWNIKSIRPVEMLPYDLTRENYFETGYVAEGVTTYMGDLFLSNSNVFNWEEFKTTQEQNLQRHSDNGGNMHAAVVESSFDLWLDGYSVGAPNRKVSIYAEGALLALMVDIQIRKHSNGAVGLQDVMTDLFHNFSLKGRGYSTSDYWALCREAGGPEIDSIFERHVFQKGFYWSTLDRILELVGLKRAQVEHETLAMNRFGIRALKRDDEIVVVDLWPNSPATNAGLEPESVLLEVNGVKLKDTLSDVLALYIDDSVVLKVQSPMRTFDVTIKATNERYFPKQTLVKAENPKNEQKALFKAWCGKDY